MRVLVTGATGFLGGRLLQDLSAVPGWQIVGTGRQPEAVQRLQHQGFEVHQGDLTDAYFVGALVPGCDAVVHAAALSAPWGPYAAFYAANVRSTEYLLQAAQKSGVERFVYISTPSIYADGRGRLNIREDDPLPKRPVNHYAATKLLGEQRVQASGLPYISLRPRAIIGAGDYTILPRLIRARLAGRLRVIGDGQNVQDLTAVSNVALAVRLSLTAPETAWNQCYNITNGEPRPLWLLIHHTLAALNLPLDERRLSYRAAMLLAVLLETAARVSGRTTEPTLTRFGVDTLAHSYTFSLEKARRLLGYTPQQTLDEAVEEFLVWYTAENAGL
jgi:2-alkyl-3-oxoalkanoate reductase